MAYSTISKPSLHFNTKLYTGNGTTTNAQTGVGFQPDFLWLKRRNGSANHFAADVVRGTYSDGYKLIVPNDTDAEADYTYVKTLDSDGFTLGSTNANVNGNGDTYVGWAWKAGGGQGSSNTAGSINTTYTSVNTTAGFSISKYTGTGANATVGHGLGVAPKMIITKCTGNTQQWAVYHSSLGATKFLRLNTDIAAATSSARWNDTAPTNSVFSVGTDGETNENGQPMIAYCFAEKTGYSKFGSYTGNGTTDNAFIYTGFKPRFFMTKRYSDTARWCMWDAARDPDNPMAGLIYANESSAEGTYSTGYLDFCSNGIKIRDGNSKWGADGSNYVYMAFGQSLVGSNNTPCNAR